MMQFVIILYEAAIIYDRERGTALCLLRARELYRERGARIT